MKTVRLLALALSIYLRAARGLFAIRIAAVVLTGLGPVAVAWLTKRLIDDLLRSSGGAYVSSVIALAVAGVLLALTQHLIRYTDRELGRRAARYATSRLFEAVSRDVGITALEHPSTHDRMRLAHQAAQSGPAQLCQTVLAITQAAFTVAGFVTTLVALFPLAAVLVVAAAMPSLVVQLKLSRLRADMQFRISPSMRRQALYSTLILDVRAAKEIRLFGLSATLRKRMLDELALAQGEERGVDQRTLRADAAGTLLTGIGSAVASWVMVARIAAGHGSVGDLSVLIGALAGVQGALASVITQLATAHQMLVLFEHYRECTASLGEPEPAAGRAVVPLRDRIVLRDVWFRYDPHQDWVLRGVNLVIEAGRSVALVGVNGAGKSTLVKLLCRLYEPTRGSITWDGVELRDLDAVALRARIAVVFQDFMNYDLTAAENIAIGDVQMLQSPGALDYERLRDAARVAGAHETLQALPHGYDTMLSKVFASPGTGSPPPPARQTRSEIRAAAPSDPDPKRHSHNGGVVLSGGQWQRVALSRAVLRSDHADLLILDEPSSGLDAIAEHDIHARLVELRATRTSLLISHRLSTVRDADLIVVLDQGRTIEEGNHASLMDAGGRYAGLFLTQASGYGDRSARAVPQAWPSPTLHEVQHQKST